MFNLIEGAKAAIGNIDAGDLLPINPLDKNVKLETVVATVINSVLWIAGVLAVIYLIYGGILYITAGGDAEKATKGRTALINAIIGIIIILLALVIVAYVKGVVK